MRAHGYFGRVLLIGCVAFGLCCDGTMNTGTVKRPANNKPAEDGSCPAGQSLCGTERFAICADLQGDPSHCGACDRSCTLGIACRAGACQQTVCTGSDIPLSIQPPAVTATPVATSGVPSSAVNVPVSTILADVNGDGRLDLVSWNAAGYWCPECGTGLNTFSVSLAQANGTFAPPSTYHADLEIQRIFTSDVNNDGMADLLVVSSTSSSSVVSPYAVDLWLGQKDGHLKKSDAPGIRGKTIDSAATESAIGDLSGDGWPDLAMVGPKLDYDAPPEISVYLSDATGALHLSQTFVAWSGDTLIRDMNHDGSPDILLFSETLEILFNRGDGTFEQPVDCGLSLSSGAVGSGARVVEDFNRDGWMDLAEYDTLSSIGALSQSPVAVMLGLGGCGFFPISSYAVPGTSGACGFLRAADMNGDGILDLVSVCRGMASDPSEASALLVTGNVLSVLIGKGDGTFQLQDTIVSLGPDTVSDVAIGAVSGDQRPDIVVTNSGPQTVKTSIVENTCQ
jgi:hypothetical protein